MEIFDLDLQKNGEIIMKKLIYIASPYTHSNPEVVEENYRKVAEFTARHTAAGYIILSPIVYGHNLAKHADMRTDWVFWQDFCFTFLSKCDELWVLKISGWNKSSGVAEEIEFAIQKGIPVRYFLMPDNWNLYDLDSLFS